MEEANCHTVALQLPNEVWNKVFACLKPNCNQLDESRVYKMVTQQAQLHHLRLVCTKFNKVIEQHPELLDSCYCVTCPASPDPAFYAGCSGTRAMFVSSCHPATLTARPFFLALLLALPLS